MVGKDKCNKKFERRRSSRGGEKPAEGQICAGGTDYYTTDTCKGDSGGPLICKFGSQGYTLVGVTSWGIGCGARTPGVYTDINSYIDWIDQNVF